MVLRILRVALISTVCLICGASLLRAQRIPLAPFVPLGSESEERLRLTHLRSASENAAYLIRSALTLSWSTRQLQPAGISFIAPEIRVVTNSALPLSFNDGPLWAGRGTSTITTAGIEVHAASVRLVLAPHLTTSENLAFQVIPFPENDPAQRSVWANPFHPAPSSIDLPYRFGDTRVRRIGLGQSSLSVGLSGLVAGVGTQNLWWGPGIRNAIVMSNNADGFAHAFVQTRDGVHTRIGRFDAQWILGRLDESGFFDRDSTNNVRSLSGLVVVWTPRADRGLSLGVSRTVFAPTTNGRMRGAAAFDVLRDVGTPNTHPTDSLKGRDQLFSFFARWVFPAAGLATYVEWARFEQPRSLRNALEFPGHSQAYTLGLEWASLPMRAGTFRLQAEATNLEPDASLRFGPVATTYTSRTVAQGYTHRGKTLGAAIGPGSSSQWLAGDLFGSTFRVGAFLERIRWDNATLWLPIVPQVKNEDISLVSGLRGSATYKGMRLLLAYTHTVRLGYLFQDKIADHARGTHAGVDLLNQTLSVTLSTAVAR